MNKYILAAILVVNTVSASKAQLLPVLGSKRVGITTAEFLKIGVGARANAMAESFAAVANDVYALFYNPAGISEGYKMKDSPRAEPACPRKGMSRSSSPA